MRSLVLLTVTLAAGCYGDPARRFLPGYMHDASPYDAWLYDATDAPDAAPEPDARVCADITTSSAAVTAVTESGNAPAAAGGALVDGVYVLESVHGYNVAAAVLYKRTWEFVGSQFALAQLNINETMHNVLAGTFTLDSPGAMLSFAATCPGTSGSALAYTFNVGDGSLDLFDYGGGNQAVRSHYVPMP